jgi:hypothetical protein
MAGEILSDPNFSHIIEAPIELIDIPTWLYRLPTEGYKRCSPDHIAAGATFADDGTRMSINVEMIGGSLLVQNYVEHVGEKDHVKLLSITDVFSPNGRTTSEVTWDLSVTKIDDNSCEYTNHDRAVPRLHRGARHFAAARQKGRINLRRPCELAFLQSFGEQAQTGRIPIKDFQIIASLA